jgi:hypothetical protein
MEIEALLLLLHAADLVLPIYMLAMEIEALLLLLHAADLVLPIYMASTVVAFSHAQI